MHMFSICFQACKREAEFLEKYFDSARAKLPETVASVRLIGREISDLAVDLSDLRCVMILLTCFSVIGQVWFVCIHIMSDCLTWTPCKLMLHKKSKYKMYQHIY
jgi:hypothetical protein